jgi:two-component system, cell cycle response regulator DivK
MAGQTILLVEDDESARYIYGTVLKHYGYEVLYARTADGGLALLQEQRPDAVVLDIGLPGVDGFEFLKRIRADPATARIPVLVATVHVFANDEEKAREAGCDVFLKKPLEPATLLKALTEVLEG